MSKHMERDLEKLQKLVLQMAGLVEEAVFEATHALHDRDGDRAARVLAGDGKIDQLENDVQEECLKILALHQPVAVDLRRTSAVLLITTDLERMGDLAIGIAERAIHISRLATFPIPDRFRPMTATATDMVRRSLDAFVHSDTAVAWDVIRMDAEVDADNAAIIDGVIAEMKRSPDHVEAGLSLFSAVRHVERIADHATNISEDVIYLVDGEIIRHHHHSASRR